MSYTITFLNYVLICNSKIKFVYDLIIILYNISISAIRIIILEDL